MFLRISLFYTRWLLCCLLRDLTLADILPEELTNDIHQRRKKIKKNVKGYSFAIRRRFGNAAKLPSTHLDWLIFPWRQEMSLSTFAIRCSRNAVPMQDHFKDSVFRCDTISRWIVIFKEHCSKLSECSLERTELFLVEILCITCRTDSMRIYMENLYL